MHAACQRDDIEIIIAEADCDPRLEEFLQTIIHTVDYKRIAMNNGSLDWHI
jgi:hypothetical protein